MFNIIKTIFKLCLATAYYPGKTGIITSPLEDGSFTTPVTKLESKSTFENLSFKDVIKSNGVFLFCFDSSVFCFRVYGSRVYRSNLGEVHVVAVLHWFDMDL